MHLTFSVLIFKIYVVQFVTHFFSGYEGVIRLLIEKGFKQQIHTKNNLGQTPLNLAVRSNRENIVNLLIDNGAELNVQDPIGATVLHWAVLESDFQYIMKHV